MWGAIASVAASAIQNGGPKPMLSPQGGPTMVNPSVSVEAMRINQPNWQLYALIGGGAFLIWRAIR